MLISANADPTHTNHDNESAYTLADKSKRRLISLLIAEATGERD